MLDWEHAIGAYQTLVEKYPDSDLADDGLYFAALAAQQMKNCTEALVLTKPELIEDIHRAYLEAGADIVLP